MEASAKRGVIQPAFTPSEQRWKYGNIVWYLFKVDVIDVFLVSLLLTLDRFHTLFWCFHYWLWISKYRFSEHCLRFAKFPEEHLYAGFFSSEAVTQRCSIKKGVLKNFSKFTGKHLRPATLLKKETLWHRCFPVDFKNTFFTEHLRTAASVVNYYFDVNVIDKTHDSSN